MGIFHRDRISVRVYTVPAPPAAPADLLGESAERAEAGRLEARGAYAHRDCTEFLPGRIRFLRNGQQAIGPNERPPFGCCLLIWGEAAR